MPLYVVKYMYENVYRPTIYYFIAEYDSKEDAEEDGYMTANEAYDSAADKDAGYDSCSYCDGTGIAEYLDEEDIDCSFCDGTGLVYCTETYLEERSMIVHVKAELYDPATHTPEWFKDKHVDDYTKDKRFSY